MDEKLNQQFQALLLRFHQRSEEPPPLEIHGITRAQMVYLDYISKNPDCRARDIADGLGYTPASVSTMVRMLETNGLLTKQSEPGDARALRLQLTDRGLGIITEIAAYRSNTVNGLLNRLHSDEISCLVKLLEKILEKEGEG